MAWVTMPALIGPVLGPPVGGFITTYATWHWIFLINVPIGLLGIVLATRYIEDVRAEQHERFDIVGMVLAGLGIAGVAFGLSVLGLNSCPGRVVAALIVGGACFIAAYLVHARRTANPALDLTLFRLPTFRASVIGGFMFRLGIGALPFLLPLMLQVGFGMTPFQSGLITFATALGAMGMKMGDGDHPAPLRLPHHPGDQCLISAAFLAVCAGFTQTTPVAVMVALLLVGGFFRSLQFTSINTIAYAEVEPRRMSRATALVSVGQQLSMSAGVAVGALGGGDSRSSSTAAARSQPAISRPPSWWSAAISAAVGVSSSRGCRPTPARKWPTGCRRRPKPSDQRSAAAASAAKPRRQQIKLGRIRAARRRLDVLHAGEVALERGEQRAFGAALQHLGEERAARRQHLAGEFGRGLDQRHDLEMIGLAVAGGVRRHVGEHHVGRPAEHRLELVRRRRIEEIELREIDARQRRPSRGGRSRPRGPVAARRRAWPRPGSSRRARRRDRPRARRA